MLPMSIALNFFPLYLCENSYLMIVSILFAFQGKCALKSYYIKTRSFWFNLDDLLYVIETLN